MPGFFDVDERLADLSAKGDDLARVKALVDFEIFRPAWWLRFYARIV
jgi:IS5 family transposase